MLSFLKHTVIGVVMLLLHALNLLICGGLLSLSGLLRFFGWGRALSDALVEPCFFLFTLNHVFFSRLLGTRFEIEGNLDVFRRDRHYMLLSNHSSWADILMLQIAFHSKIPTLKFFMKKQLLWVPFIGTASYVGGFPFMARHSKKELEKNPDLRRQDFETTKKSCQRFEKYPSTVVNFAEGTRCTQEKKERTQSPYRYLLRPKAGGVAIALLILREKIREVIDVTIIYPKFGTTLWDYFSGRVSYIRLRVNVLPVTPDLLGSYEEDPQFRMHFQSWLNQLWEEKDECLKEAWKK